MLRVRNGEKGDRGQYFEGVTVVSLIMCIESCSTWNGWRGKHTRCDPKVLRQVVLKEYCALYLAADTITT
jgi:hypothetical protein